MPPHPPPPLPTERKVEKGPLFAQNDPPPPTHTQKSWLRACMDSASVPVFISSFAYNFVKKKARITIFGMWVTSRWIMDRLKYF